MAYKTPGVYVVEKNAFPNSVVEVATAVPAFIGYTERADNKGTSLRDRAWRITSMSQFIEYFGGPPPASYTLEPAGDGENEQYDFIAPKPGGAPGAPVETARFRLKSETAGYLLYYSMQLFYQNGGGACYIVSVGDYASDISGAKLKSGLEVLRKEQEPTMVVVPEAMRLKGADPTPWSDAVDVQQAVLKHCGADMKNRFAILDVYDGYRARSDNPSDCIADFRDALGVNQLDFGAAYYPWVDTSIVPEAALSFLNIANRDVLAGLLRTDLKVEGDAPTDPIPKKSHEEKVEAVKNLERDWKPNGDKLKTDDDVLKAQQALHQMLVKFSPVYGSIITAIARRLNRLPPAAAMAGVYTAVDNARGVWKAPANVSLNSVIAPTVAVSHDEQEDLNVTTAGKSINAIRAFIGSGVLVWGARTLDGNSLDWRYINVRRTMLMLEESLRLALGAYVFEPNEANTWVTVKGMINNFLTSIWKRGGLAGSSPDDAFQVSVGLGETMTGEDILEGRMNITVLVALSRPAEFIIITFQQQMQKS